MSTEVKVPTLGEIVTEATIGQWLKQPGEAVRLDEPIASLETDKVAVEVPAPVAGVMGEQLAAVGDTVAVGAVIATIEDGVAAAGAEPVAARTEAAMPPARIRWRPSRPQPLARAGQQRRRRRRALAGGAPRGARTRHRPGRGQGHRQGRPADQGRRGRRRRSSSTRKPGARRPSPAAPAHAGLAKSPASRPEGRARGAGQMTRLRQTIARRLKEAQDTAALLTTFNDCDMTAVIAARDRYKELFEKKHGVSASASWASSPRPPASR